jgi:sodium-dependent dicarboxylate transporter 2/3/5
MPLRRSLLFLLGPLLFALVQFLLPLPGIGPAARTVLAATAWIAAWWMTEAVEIEVTALLPLLLFPLSGALSLKASAAPYAHPLIFLYMGGFFIALAIERWELHRRIALRIILWIGTRPPQVLGGFMLATALLSMWISNTATALMMLPIGLAVVRQMGEERRGLPAALMLGIAYAASIGGIATPVGTPPNLVFQAELRERFGQEMGFSEWTRFVGPLALLLLLAAWGLLASLHGLWQRGSDEGAARSIREAYAALGPLAREEARVLAVFCLTAFAWIGQPYLIKPWFPAIDDTLIALLGGLSLFLLPAGGRQPLLDWKTAMRMPWGILLVFGGGMSLAEAFDQSGLAAWIGQQLEALGGAPYGLILLSLVALMVFLTEVTSNLATASLMMPVLATLAPAMGFEPAKLMLPAVVAISCAFMFPVATPPNAIVFGSGHLRMQEMARAGFWLNLICIALVWAYIYFLG